LGPSARPGRRDQGFGLLHTPPGGAIRHAHGCGGLVEDPAPPPVPAIGWPGQSSMPSLVSARYAAAVRPDVPHGPSRSIHFANESVSGHCLILKGSLMQRGS
jgi:hypothetical protein